MPTLMLADSTTGICSAAPAAALFGVAGPVVPTTHGRPAAARTGAATGAGGRGTEIHGGIGAGGEGGGEVGADRHAQGREARGGTDVLSGERGIGAVHGGHDEAGDGARIRPDG